MLLSLMQSPCRGSFVDFRNYSHLPYRYVVFRTNRCCITCFSLTQRQPSTEASMSSLQPTQNHSEFHHLHPSAPRSVPQPPRQFPQSNNSLHDSWAATEVWKSQRVVHRLPSRVERVAARHAMPDGAYGYGHEHVEDARDPGTKVSLLSCGLRS